MKGGRKNAISYPIGGRKYQKKVIPLGEQNFPWLGLGCLPSSVWLGRLFCWRRRVCRSPRGYYIFGGERRGQGHWKFALVGRGQWGIPPRSRQVFRARRL